MTDKIYAVLIVFVQCVCAIFVLLDNIPTMFGLPIKPLDWETKELMQAGASVGLLVAVILGAAMLRQTFKRAKNVELTLLTDSPHLLDLLEQLFEDWKLTRTEREIALFAIRGIQPRQIANFMEMSERSVSAETMAICKKAGVSNEPELHSFVVDRLVSDKLVPCHPFVYSAEQQFRH